MLKRWKWGVLIVCVILVCGLVWVFIPESQPSEQGRTLREWLHIYQAAGSGRPYLGVTREQLGETESSEQRDAAAAVRRMGARSIPNLLKWLQYQKSPWRGRLDGVVSRAEQTFLGQWGWSQTIFRTLRSPDELDARSLVMLGFSILGEDAKSAIPELVRLTNHPDDQIRSRAIYALARLGRDGLGALLKIADSDSLENGRAIGAIASMSYLGTNASAAIPFLVQTAFDPDPDVAWEAVSVLCNLHIEPELSFPAFTNALASTNRNLKIGTIHYLGHFPAVTRLLVSSLSNCLHDADGVVSSKAQETLFPIAPEIFLRSTDSNVRRQANMQIAADGVWLPVSEVEPYVRACLLDADEEVRRQATNALLKISPEAFSKASLE